jgi:hypothetical protein
MLLVLFLAALALGATYAWQSKDAAPTEPPPVGERGLGAFRRERRGKPIPL